MASGLNLRVLHVALACQDDTADVVHLALVVAFRCGIPRILLK